MRPCKHFSSRHVLSLASLLVTGFFYYGPTEALAVSYERAPEIIVSDGKDLIKQNSFIAYPKDFRGGATVAAGDVNGDGFQEIITGAGPGAGPHVKIFTSKGFFISQFFAFDQNFKKGLVVGSGDILGDSRDEIIVGTRPGGGPHVKVFDQDGTMLLEFFAFEKDFRGGVLLAAGDVTGGDKDEIIVAAGPSGGPHVRVFGETGEWTGIDFSPFASDLTGGVSVASGNIDGGEKDEIVMAIHSSGEPRVKIYKADEEKTVIGNWLAYQSSFQGGVNVTTGDFDHDGQEEVATAPNIGGGPHVRVFEASGQPLNLSATPYEKDFRGGVFLSAGETDGDGRVELIAAPGKKFAEGRTDLYKYIEIDLSEQRLQAFENGYKKFDFLISSGTKKYPTPEGEFAVWRRRPKVRMTWIYGPDNPDNYDLENVPDVLSFNGPYAIHGAYWHNNFGRPMSHGCVNASLKNAAAIYPWADFGTKVIVKK